MERERERYGGKINTQLTHCSSVRPVEWRQKRRLEVKGIEVKGGFNGYSTMPALLDI